MADVFLAGGALTAAFLTAAFLAGADFFAAGECAFNADFFAAQRFFKAATMFALPALLSVRFGLAGAGAVGAGGAASPRTFAHLRCWASFMRRIAAGENFRRFRCGGASVVFVVAGLAEAPDSMARSSPIWASIRVFCVSNPSMAALTISGVSLVGISVSLFTTFHSIALAR